MGVRRLSRILLAVFLLVATNSMAADIHGRSSTQFLWFNDIFTNKTQDEIAQYLQIGITNIDKAGKLSIYGYGRGRGEQTVLSGIIKPITFIPSIFLLYILLLPLANKAVYYLPLLCYLILSLIISVFEGIRGGRLRSALLLPVVFPFFHLCYGLGMIWGLCSCIWKQAPQGDADVTIRRVKEFGAKWKVNGKE